MTSSEGSNKGFSKGDTTTWSYELYKNTDFVIYTIPSYEIDQIPERNNEVSLKKKRNQQGKKRLM